MSSIIKVDTIQNQSGANIISESANTITVGASGDTVTIPSGATLSSSGTVSGNLANTPSFEAHMSANQSLSNDSWTKVQLANEIFDTNSAFDSTTNYRFTVPTGLGGKYLFHYGAQIADINDTKRGAARFYKNGAGYNFGRNNNYSSSVGAALYCTGSAIISMNAGDYLELYVYQNNGDAQAVYSAATFLSGSRIIGA